MLEFQVIPSKDLGGGEDAKSAPSSILEGYCDSLLNVDTNSSGWVGTRKGYQGYFGWVPLRVTEVSHSGTTIQFKVGSSSTVDLSRVGTMPIVVFGRLPSQDAPDGGYLGDFGTSDQLRYYPSFNIERRYVLTPPNGTLTLEGEDHGLNTHNLFVALAKSTHPNKTDHTLIWPDGVSINQANNDISIDYTTNDVETAKLFYLPRDEEIGITHIEQVSAKTSVTVSASTHNLQNFNFIVKCYDTDTDVGSAVQVIPDEVSIDTSGNVTVSFLSPFTGDIIITSASNATTTTASAGSNTITIPNISSPWVFLSIYAYDASTTKLVQVLPDSISYSEDSEELSIEYYLAAGSENVEVYYEYGSAVSNAISVTDTKEVSETYISSNPQITIWGIPHTGIYSDGAQSGGHVVHIDTYKRTDESRAVCGLGGNIFAARTRDEEGITYGMPSFVVNLRSRVSDDFDLAPLFQTRGSGVSRTRGVVEDDTIEDNRARVVAVSYVSAGVVDYTLSFADKSGDISLGGVVADTDLLTVSGLAYEGYNGSFPILSIEEDSTTSTVIRCSNDAAFISDFDETGADARAGVFTDNISVLESPPVRVGDGVLSSAISEEVEVGIISSSGMDLVLSGITTQVSLPSGVLIFFQRNTDVVPLRTASIDPASEYLVRGDMLEVSGLARQVRVKHVNPDDDNDITSIISADGTATVTLDNEHHLSVGQRVLLVGTGVPEFEGEQTITSLPSSDSFTFFTDSTATSSQGKLVGHTAHLDEELTIQDGTSDATTLSVFGRWIPVEIPTPTQDLAPETKTRIFDTRDFANQNITRSTIIADTMYFVDGDDEVHKFDGDSIYQAGLIPWQPQLFVEVDTRVGSIVVDTTSVDWTAKSNNKFTVGLGDSAAFAVGDRVQDSSDSAVYSIIKTTSDGDNDAIYVDRDISGSSSGTLSLVSRFRYYFRLHAIDSNNNIIASAATGASDFHVELSEAAQVRMRLVGLPTLGVYDYDRIELQVYRTKANTAAPFYLNRTVPVNFDHASGYIDVDDGTPDELLRDFDNINTALLGAEIGTTWNQPLRAKYVTSADNRLILTNIKDYPELNITLRRKSSSVSLSPSDLDKFRWLLRRSNLDTGTTTNMLDRVAFEFVDGGQVSFNPAADLSRSSTQFTVTSAAHGLSAGDWVYLFHAAEGTNNSLRLSGWWQIAEADTNTFTVNFPNNLSLTSSFTFADEDVDTTDDIITKANHGLKNGAQVVLSNEGGELPTGLSASTSYYVVGATTNTFQLSTTEGGSAVDITAAAGGGTHTLTYSYEVNTYVTATEPKDVPVWLGEDGNHNWIGANPSTSYEFIAALRLASAINSVSTMTDRQIEGQETYTPWLTARAGSEYSAGQVVIRQPVAGPDTMELMLPTISPSAAYQVFVNNLLRDSEEQISAFVRLFPSRVLISYQGFPEIFDNPYGVSGEGDSAVDINAADGQEAVGAIPLFGSSSFGGGQVESKIIVFKTTSIYQLDLKTLQYQEINQPYGGCTVPYSITQTKDGVMFANESGIYRLNHNLTVTRIGEFEERRWKKEVNQSALPIATGHNFRNGNQYKLSVPYGEGQETNNYVFVYDYTREGQGRPYGAWTRHTNFPATGWANLGNDSLFATTDGQVFKIRNANDNSDYRDDAQAISAEIVTRSVDFDLPGVNKVVSGVLLEFHNDGGSMSGVVVSTAADLEREFQESDSVDITSSTKSVESAWFSLARRKCVRMQTRITCNQKDSPFVLASMAHRVAALDHRGTPESRNL